MDTVRRELESTPSLAVLFVRIERWGDVSRLFSWREVDAAFDSASRLADEMLGRELRQLDLPADLGQGEGLAIVLSPPRGGGELRPADLETVAERVGDAIRRYFAGSLAQELHERLTVEVGAGSIRRPTGDGTLEESLVAGLDEAAAAAVSKVGERLEDMRADLVQALEQGGPQVRYQPVLDLTARRVAGFEALPEGPFSRGLNHADVLVDVGARAGLTYRLYDAYHQVALGEPAGSIASHEFLLLRSSVPELLEAAVRVTSALYGRAHANLSQGNIAFLLPGAELLADFPAGMAAVRSVGEMGFKIAVDLDPGCAPALDELRELEPDFLRMGGRSVRRVSSQPDEFELLLMMSRFAGRHNIQLLAADCLERAEILALRRAGVRLASGGYLAPAGPRPARPELHLP
jgi:EAL domain-containing protein (putative c-di-GMP-specific phosphodiesterase class I)